MTGASRMTSEANGTMELTGYVKASHWVTRRDGEEMACPPGGWYIGQAFIATSQPSFTMDSPRLAEDHKPVREGRQPASGRGLPATGKLSPHGVLSIGHVPFRGRGHLSRMLPL
jgi:hypothetical protein